MDHTPAEALGRKARGNDGLRRVWYWACRDEAIQPRNPSRLPLLFALNAKLAIANGLHYVADCSGVISRADRSASDGNASPYCGESFADGHFSGDADHFGGVESSGGGVSDGFSTDVGGTSGGDGGCSSCGGD